MRDRRSDRGAVLIEFSIVAIFLCMMAFGVVEMGVGWQDRMTVQTAARAGVRVASNLTTNAAADYNTLLAVRSAVEDIGATNVEYVVIYNASAANGTVPLACVSATGVVASSSVAGAQCNAYTGAQLTALNATQFGCGTGKLDNFWCPINRHNLLATGPDYLGVWIRVKHTRLTGMFGSGVTHITDNAVMRLEPLT